MKHFMALILVFALLGCQKQIDSKSTEMVTATEVSSNASALQPLKYHATSFTTNYPTVPGGVPPFRFAKTLYGDTRVKTINMLSRALPNYSTFKNQAFETIGTFTYSPNAARFTGTVETWEYFKTAAGAAGRKSIKKQNVTINFGFNSLGLCSSAVNSTTKDYTTYRYNNDDEFPKPPYVLSFVDVGNNSRTQHLYYMRHDDIGNITIYDSPYGVQSMIIITYDYTKSINSSVYIPTQYAISFEHNLVEVMQWLPRAKNQRKSVSIKFDKRGWDVANCWEPPCPVNPNEVTQSQKYLNQKYDANGNLISYTYGDGVLQKISWYPN